jgi:hypothetical protein
VLAVASGRGASVSGQAASQLKKPPVYILDPGLDELAVRPEYISFKIEAQRFTWIRNLRWQAWGGDAARGRGLLESCAGGHCTRVTVAVRLWHRRPRHCSTGSSYTRITYLRGRPVTRRADPYVCENN